MEARLTVSKLNLTSKDRTATSDTSKQHLSSCRPLLNLLSHLNALATAQNSVGLAGQRPPGSRVSRRCTPAFVNTKRHLSSPCMCIGIGMSQPSWLQETRITAAALEVHLQRNPISRWRPCVSTSSELLLYMRRWNLKAFCQTSARTIRALLSSSNVALSWRMTLCKSLLLLTLLSLSSQRSCGNDRADVADRGRAS